MVLFSTRGLLNIEKPRGYRSEIINMDDRTHFDKIAEEFDNKFNSYFTKAGQWRVRRRVNFFSDYAKIDAGSRILEIGCGTGEYTRYLVETGAEIHAVDISAKMIRLAQRKCPFCNVKFKVADMRSLPHVDGYFDAVVGNAILHHVTNPKSVFDEIRRVLKKDGRIAFAEPNMLNPQIALQKNIGFLKKVTGDTSDETAFFRWHMAKILKKEGFENIEIRPVEFLHPYTPDIFVSLMNDISNIFEKIPVIREIGGSLLISAAKK